MEAQQHMLEFVENVQFGTENVYSRIARAYEEFKKKMNWKTTATRMTSPGGAIPWLVTLPVAAHVPPGVSANCN